MSSPCKKKKEEPKNPPCPVCHHKEHVGFLGGSSCKTYFCSSCCKEFSVNKSGSIEVHGINSNGTLD